MCVCVCVCVHVCVCACVCVHVCVRVPGFQCGCVSVSALSVCLSVCLFHSMPVDRCMAVCLPVTVYAAVIGSLHEHAYSFWFWFD